MTPDEQKRMEQFQLRALRAEDEVERLRTALKEISGQILLGDCLDIANAALAEEEA
jgi:hypothetical protein